MALSEAKRAANRRNAQHSTGPRSAAGKARSSQNALKHGLRTERVLLGWEDPAEFDEFQRGLVDDFRPMGTFEETLVLQIIGFLWRLRRVPWIESGLIRLELRHGGRLQHPEPPYQLRSEDRLAYAFSDLDVSRSVTVNLPRYEAELMRRLRQSWKMLGQCQARRRAGEKSTNVGQALLAPSAIMSEGATEGHAATPTSLLGENHDVGDAREDAGGLTKELPSHGSRD